jgi:hypothetical protein
MRRTEADPSRANVLALGKMDEQVRRLASRFGLTPGDRAALRVTGKEKPSGKSRLLDGETR